MTTVLLIIHFFIAAFLVGVILLQRSEGGALGGLGGGAGGLMTSRGTTNLLTRATAILGAAFFATSLIIAIMLRSPDSHTSILDIVEEDLGIEDTIDNGEEKKKGE